MITRIDEQGKDSELMKLQCKMKEVVYPLLFENLESKFKPSLVHGDLWSGNSGVDQENGEVIIFDPSSCYAHNEFELGIMHMFGGYNSQFFDAYHQVIPRLQPYYDERIKCYELYHHLNREKFSHLHSPSCSSRFLTYLLYLLYLLLLQMH